MQTCVHLLELEKFSRRNLPAAADDGVLDEPEEGVAIALDSGSEPLCRWLLRLLFFKLMIMSGAVKILSEDNVWLELTALKYHFATQCIPMPAAWYIANLSSEGFSRFAVAVTFWVPAPPEPSLSPFTFPRTREILRDRLSCLWRASSSCPSEAFGISLPASRRFFRS